MIPTCKYTTCGILGRVEIYEQGSEEVVSKWELTHYPLIMLNRISICCKELWSEQGIETRYSTGLSLQSREVAKSFGPSKELKRLQVEVVMHKIFSCKELWSEQGIDT